MRTFGRSPFSDILALQDQVDRLFRETRSRHRGTAISEGWQPVIDIATTPEAFYVRLDMAGVAREDIKASVQDNALVVRGDKGSSARDGVRVIRSERVFGDFTRTIPLPSDADENDIAASLSRGVLELRIGRRSARGAREIEIRAGE